MAKAKTIEKDVASIHSHRSGSPPSQHHHHDHHHTHSHYEREVKADGTVIEKTVTEEIKETPAEDAEPAEPVPTEGLSKNQRKKANKKAREAAAAAAAAVAAVQAIEEGTTAPTEAPPPASLPIPGSPTPSKHSHHSHHSHKSHRSHHHPEIIVNVNAAAAPAPAPAPAPVPAPAPPPAPATLAPPIDPHTIPLPASRPPTVVPSSPAASVRSMRLPKFTKPKPALVQAIPEDDEMEVLPGQEVVTKVITTTTTTRRPASPPETGPVPMVMDPSKGYVENDPDWKYEPPKAKSIAPPPPPPPPAPPTPPPPVPTPPRGSPDRFIERTTVETISYPVNMSSAATTMGRATTKGIGGARTAALSQSSGGRTGTKAGLKPISYVDYENILRATPPVRKPSLPLPAPVPVPAAPRGPQTVATMSAHLDVDSKGNEHLYARLRDHTGVVKDVEEIKAPAPTHYTSSKGRKYRVIDEIPEDRVFSPSQSWKKPGLRYKIIEEVEADAKGTRRYKIKEDDDLESISVIEEKKDKKKGKEKKGPIYKPLDDVVPPPKSERYAYPPAPTEIAKNAKERFWNRFGMGSQPNPPAPGPGGPAMGGYGGPGYPPMAPFPTPQPMTMPAPTPMMGSRPPMFGPPMNPMMGMGMGMGLGGVGTGMGMMGMPMPRMGVPYAPVAGMGYGMMPGYGAGRWR